MIMPVNFDIASRGRLLEWLDMTVMRDSPLTFHETMPEDPWINGSAEFPTRYRIRPHLGRTSLDMNMLRSYVAGKAARWQQLDLAHAQLSVAVRYQLRLWQRAGYPQNISLKCWRQAPRRFGVSKRIRSLILHAQHGGNADQPDRRLPRHP